MKELVTLLTILMILIAYFIKIAIIVIEDMSKSPTRRLAFIIACTVVDAIVMIIFLTMEWHLLWRYDLIYLICDFGFSTVIYLFFNGYDLDNK